MLLTKVLQGSEGVKQAVMAGLGIAMVSRIAITLERCSAFTLRDACVRM